MAPHVAIPWVMAFDLRPMETMREKEQWLSKAAEQNWTILLQHDPTQTTGRVSLHDQRFRWEAVDEGHIRRIAP